MEAGDYDVRLSFGEKIIHGAVPSDACMYRVALLPNFVS